MLRRASALCQDRQTRLAQPAGSSVRVCACWLSSECGMLNSDCGVLERTQLVRAVGKLGGQGALAAALCACLQPLPTAFVLAYSCSRLFVLAAHLSTGLIHRSRPPAILLVPRLRAVGQRAAARIQLCKVRAPGRAARTAHPRATASCISRKRWSAWGRNGAAARSFPLLLHSQGLGIDLHGGTFSASITTRMA